MHSGIAFPDLLKTVIQVAESINPDKRCLIELQDQHADSSEPNSSLIHVCYCVCFGYCSAACAIDWSGDGNVKIAGLRSKQEQGKTAAFNSPESWLGEHPAYSTTLTVDSQTVTWKLRASRMKNMAWQYSHNENRNGKMDKNFLGIPHEAYGFSNTIKVVQGPIKWEKSKVVVNGSTTDVPLRLIERRPTANCRYRRIFGS
jgi:uncharacterized protein (DUF2141 family)